MTVQIMRLGAPGEERPAVRTPDGTTYDLNGVTREIDGVFLANDGIAQVAAAVEAGTLPVLDGADALRVGAPIARPAAVVCIGQNYAAHAAESGSEPPKHPMLFLKHPNTVVGPYDDVRIPRGAEQTDWEVELGVVFAKRTSYVSSAEEALAAIAGYVVGNDVSERHLQRDVSGGQFSKGKCAPTFCPVGPGLVPAAEVQDPQRLALRSWVNGEPRQDSNTSDMVFTVAELIQDVSQVLTFEPGDLLLTGTPEGVAMSGRFPYLVAGDVLELEVEGLGKQRQTLVDA